VSLKKSTSAKGNSNLSRVPIYLNGYLIGGVGVSGGTVPQDEKVATAGVLALNASTAAN
jgi:uncharacterized protein GlcG (DUF336 family)